MSFLDRINLEQFFQGTNKDNFLQNSDNILLICLEQDFSESIPDTLLVKIDGNTQFIYLPDNKISIFSIGSLAETVAKAERLHLLNLENNNLSTQGASLLLSYLSDNPKSMLEVLNLSNNCIDSIDPSTLEGFFKRVKLQTLILDYNSLGSFIATDETLKTIFRHLAYKDQTLKELSLKKVKLNEAHLKDLLNGLLENTSLKKLNLDGALDSIPNDRISDFIFALQKKNLAIDLGTISFDLFKLLSFPDNNPTSLDVYYQLDSSTPKHTHRLFKNADQIDLPGRSVHKSDSSASLNLKAFIA